ncbi:hypothetical protein MANES_08G075650v8 [Manihot esculenta]|uniref:Uncharacterized protein n=1 Tax=Manihot esculenta TaxID=3983 RepID=A0ACB7HB99_MANES|nr:hypothetical protein MANES_08G075650v8 [Manihot esculenta]
MYLNMKKLLARNFSKIFLVVAVIALIISSVEAKGRGGVGGRGRSSFAAGTGGGMVRGSRGKGSGSAAVSWGAASKFGFIHSNSKRRTLKLMLGLSEMVGGKKTA